MSNLSNALQSALSDQAKFTLVSIIAENPKTTVEDLRKLISDHPVLGDLSLSELMGKKGVQAPRKNKTQADREIYDQEVYAALKLQGGEDVPAAQLRGSVKGGDPAQIRNALNRLIESGLVTFTGVARGTRYSVSDKLRIH